MIDTSKANQHTGHEGIEGLSSTENFAINFNGTVFFTRMVQFSTRIMIDSKGQRVLEFPNRSN